MILQKGDSGSKVKMLQQALNRLGANLDPDGGFGDLTEAALETEQTQLGLPVTGTLDTSQLSMILAKIQNPPASGPGSVPPSTPQPTSPISAPSSGKGPVKLIDIFHQNPVTSWVRVAAANIVGAICKASEGLGEDVAYVANRAGALAAGLLFGAYHFMSFTSSGAAQANFYWSRIVAGGGNPKTDFSPSCDWEYADGRDPSDHDIAIVKDFMATLQGHCPGRVLGLYMSEAMYVYLRDEKGLGDWLNQFWIWIAEYGVSTPKGHVPWIIWQTGEGSVPGISGNGVDLDVFNGSLDDLKAFIAKT